MAFKCYECGNIFDECEIKTWTEVHGETHGGCPLCGAPFGITRRCKVCGGEFLEEELSGRGVCDECIDTYKNDFDFCYRIADEEKEEVKINALLAALFNPKEIEMILVEHLKKNEVKIDCSKFVELYKDWFIDMIYEEVN